MKKWMVLLSLAAVTAVPAAATAAEAFVYADVLSAYVFNGQVGNDEPVFQPGLDVTGPLGLAFNIWANMDLTNSERSWAPDSAFEWSEIDPGFSWTAPWEGPVSLTLGGLYYIFPQDTSAVETDEAGAVVDIEKRPADGRYEVFVKVKADDVLLAPGVKVCHDMANQDDWIALFSIGHSFGLTEALALDLGAILGYAGEYYVEENYGSTTGDAFTHAQFDAILSYALSDQASVGLRASYSSILDGDIRDDIDETDFYPETDIFYGGLTASYSF